MQLPKNLTEDLLQLLNGGMGNVFFIKAFVGEVELLPKGLAVERRFSVGGKDPVGGLEDRGEVVHQGAGPVEDQVSNHRLGSAGSFVYVYDYVYESMGHQASVPT